MTRIAISSVWALLLVSGCYNPDLSGSGGFKCAKTKECPEGFECINEVCVSGDVHSDGPLVDRQVADAEHDGPGSDGPGSDGIPPKDLPTSPSCSITSAASPVTSLNVGSSFSFNISDNGLRAASFQTSSPSMVYQTTLTGGWVEFKVEAGDESAVDFDTSGSPIVAFHAQNDTLRMRFNKGTYNVDTATSSGTQVSIGAHPNLGYRWLTYVSGGGLKRAWVKVVPASTFGSGTEVVTPAESATTLTAPAQSLLTGASQAIAYVTLGATPRLYVSVGDLLTPNKWTHTPVEDLTGTSIKEYAVSMPRIGASPLLWTKGSSVRERFKNTNTTLFQGTRAHTDLSSLSQQAIVYVDNGSLIFVSRKNLGTTYLPPVTLHKLGSGGLADHGIVRANPTFTKAGSARWEVVYRKVDSAAVQQLLHVVIDCTY